MPTEIVMPRLSDTMSEGTVAKWRKQVGEKVDRGEILAEIETDKAVMELEAFQVGVLGRILVPEGQTVPIGVPIALLVALGEELPPETTPATSASAPAVAPATASPSMTAPSALTAPSPTPPPSESPPLAEGRVRASPVARRLAEAHGLDLGRIVGTGPGGRIGREDVEAYVGRMGTAAPPQAPPPPRAAAPAEAPAPVTLPGLTEEEELVPLSTMQQTIARRMAEIKTVAPEFYVTTEVDMAKAIAFRRSLNEALGEGQHVTFNDIIVKTVALALRSFPEVNASYRDGHFVRYKGIHIGVAVAIPDGLVVPIVRNADQKSLVQIAQETRELVEKAQNRRLTIQEMEGSTFSVTNLGMYDVDQFTGILNQPNAAILAVGSIVRKPVVQDDQIGVSDRMRLTLTVDHRVFYGATAAQFLREVKRILEHPMLLVL